MSEPILITTLSLLKSIDIDFNKNLDSDKITIYKHLQNINKIVTNYNGNQCGFSINMLDICFTKPSYTISYSKSHVNLYELKHNENIEQNYNIKGIWWSLTEIEKIDLTLPAKLRNSIYDLKFSYMDFIKIICDMNNVKIQCKNKEKYKYKELYTYQLLPEHYNNIINNEEIKKSIELLTEKINRIIKNFNLYFRHMWTWYIISLNFFSWFKTYCDHIFYYIRFEPGIYFSKFNWELKKLKNHNDLKIELNLNKIKIEKIQ